MSTFNCKLACELYHTGIVFHLNCYNPVFKKDFSTEVKSLFTASIFVVLCCSCQGSNPLHFMVGDLEAGSPP